MPTFIPSQIDNSKMVYPEQWVLSLVAKPKGKNPEHAFIIVEGLIEGSNSDENQFVYRRYDFVTGDKPEYLTQTILGIVLVKNEPQKLKDLSPDGRTDYFWRTVMKDGDQKEDCKGATWIITSTQANELHESVLKDKAKPSPYNITGNTSVLGPSSSQKVGHNCYTWARTKVLEINETSIQKDERLVWTIADFVAARTTNHLNKPVLEEEKPSKHKYLSFS